MQMGKEVEAVGGPTDGVIVKEVGKEKKIISGSQSIVNDTLSNVIQNGNEVEAVGRATDGVARKEVEKKKKKEKKKMNKIINDIELPVNDTSFKEMQNGKEFVAVATDVDVVKEVERKKKKKSISVHSRPLQQENTCLNANEAQENKDQNGEGAKLEGIGEDCEVENIRKQKKKRENKKENDVSGDSGQGILAKKSMNSYDKKKKKKLFSVDSGALQQEITCLTANEAQVNKDENGEGAKLEAIGEDCEVETIKKRKKKKKREKKETDVSGDSGQVILAEDSTNGNANSILNEESDKDLQNGGKRKRKKAKSVDNGSKDPKARKSKKKVRFSGTVEVFPPSDDNLVRGKRFSKEEDEIVKEAVFDYIEAHCLGEEGLNMVLNCRSHPEVKNCWKEITTCLPHRPHSAIYYRAQVLFRRDKKRKWTQEEIELLRESHKTRGNQWKELAEELGKHRFHVKDTWRRIRHENLKKGRWSQEEYQSLFDLVNTDLRMKYYVEKKSKHGMLRDNIPWAAISDKLSTRPEANCCLKWYNHLTSSMVAEGLWADVDDYRLIDALFQLDASCIEDVDWDNLLDHRSGDVCLKRWNQMVLHIGDNQNESFADQIEVLAKRYCPDLLEARETWDSKPIVP